MTAGSIAKTPGTFSSTAGDQEKTRSAALTKPARIGEAGLGGNEPAAGIEASVRADPLRPKNAREIEPLDQARLAGTVVTKPEDPRHEAQEDAVDVGDTERRRETRELCERQHGRREGVAHLIHREEHRVRTGLVQRERVGVRKPLRDHGKWESM